MSLHSKKTWLLPAVIALLGLQALQMVIVLRKESLTWDEANHMYAGYRMWKDGDYGLNPEHPPLVKLLAALPILEEKLWVPPLKGSSFEDEAYFGGRDWLEHNDGASQRLVYRMRLADGLLSIALSLVIFISAREWFGTAAALVALSLIVFEPNILAHSGLVTTDVGAALFFVASTYTFYRYVVRPSWIRLAIGGITMGLLLATKHSGVLICPMLLVLVCYEIAITSKGRRAPQTLLLGGGLAVMVLTAVGVLWASYGFRYVARPTGLQLSPALDVYEGSLGPFFRMAIYWSAHLRILPESYLEGLVHVRLNANLASTYILGAWHPHGVWWYFPVTILIKTTLGMLGLVLLAGYAIVEGRLREELSKRRALVYTLFVWVAYLATAMLNGLNIGVRHLLPMYAFAALIAGAGVGALAPRSRAWMCVCLALIAAHIASALSVFPDSMAYANEAWGGARNTHRLLNDSNVDWGRQLYQVKAWEDRHPSEDCWFAYTARPYIRPETYGVHCHILPNGNGGAGEEIAPPLIHGSVLLSASEVDGTLWPSPTMNPYSRFTSVKPDEEIDFGVLVYRGEIALADVNGVSRAFLAWDKLKSNQPQQALRFAEDGAKMAPHHLFVQWALGDAATAAGKVAEARSAYEAAIQSATVLDPERRAMTTMLIQDSINRLQGGRSPN